MKYKKVAQCPANLKRLIDLVNILPEDAQTATHELCELGSKYSERYSLDEQVEDIVGSGFIKDYLFDRAGETFSLEELSNYFYDLVKAKRLFEEIASTFKKSQSDRWGKIYFVREQFYRSSSLRFEVGLTIDEKGFIKPRYDELLMIFKDDISPERIRVCKICSSIFWAKKLNAETCGEKNCASTLYNHKRLARIKKENEDKERMDQFAEESKKKRREIWKNMDFSKN